MSRIGKLPITVPDKVEVSITQNGDGTQTITVKGPKGQLTKTFRAEIEVVKDGSTLTVKRRNESREARALHGLTRTLVDNMVLGVSKGFVKNLEIVGVGYKAQAAGNKITLQLGHSHPIVIEAPKEIQFKVDANTKVEIAGVDKQMVGDFAAAIRSKRPPEPYKGKGVKYAGEKIRRKAGKAGAKK